MKTDLHITSRNEATLAEMSATINHLCTVVRDLSIKLDHQRKETNIDFSAINEPLPLLTMDAFNEFETKIASDRPYKDLLVSNV